MNRIYLTEAGRDIRDRAMASHVEIVSEAMDALAPDEQQALVNLLRRLERGLDTCQPPARPE